MIRCCCAKKYEYQDVEMRDEQKEGSSLNETINEVTKRKFELLQYLGASCLVTGSIVILLGRLELRTAIPVIIGAVTALVGIILLPLGCTLQKMQDQESDEATVIIE